MSGPDSYSRAERLLHRLAFASVPAQIALADIEEGLFGSSAGIAIERPLFVAGLPRAGTTLLLQILAELPDFTSHTYRHMPFLLCPFTWQRLSGAFRKESALAERAHGDGVAVGFDSPEAFEEVIWKAYWPEKYGKTSIGLWGREDRNGEFEAFYFQHIRKVLALAAKEEGGAHRYLCKNNANIARLSLLPALFPDCRIIVPVRRPLDHARSLRRQHVQFSALHAEDAFARRYMEWLGHYEFGAALKPIDFGGWMAREGEGLDPPALDPLGLDFWLAYWAAAHDALLSTPSAHVLFVDYDGLCREPSPGLTRLARVCGLEETRLDAAASRFRAPTPYEAAEDYDPARLDRAEEIYRSFGPLFTASPSIP